MYCSNCGTKIEDGIRFCPECGSPVTSSISQNTQPVASMSSVQTASVANQVATSDVAHTTSNTKPSTKFKRPSGGAKLGAVLFALIGGLFLAVLLIMLSCRYLVSKESIKSLINNQQEEVQEIYDDVLEDYADDLENYGVSIEDIQSIEGYDEILSQVSSDMIEYALTGEGEMIDENYVIDWIEEHQAEIEEATGYEISKEDLKDLKKEIKEQKQEIQVQVEETVQENEAYAIVQKIFSDMVLYILIGIVAFCFLLIFAIFGKNLDKSLIYTGVTSLVHGLIGVITAFIMTYVTKYFDNSIIEGLISFASSRYMFVTGIAAGAGLILIIGGLVFRKCNHLPA